MAIELPKETIAELRERSGAAYAIVGQFLLFGIKKTAKLNLGPEYALEAIEGLFNEGYLKLVITNLDDANDMTKYLATAAYHTDTDEYKVDKSFLLRIPG
ncbi:hypothetical protein LCGC14_2115070 [marine sediment metagenome]|uniref:Uncharacterized protein n=1 Tax=marine sediment metagenome TaxID=412755 RepID=A0A0F9H295_9ZZZZ